MEREWERVNGEANLSGRWRDKATDEKGVAIYKPFKCKQKQAFIEANV